MVVADPPPKADVADLQEVVVSGLRASLEKSLDIKKNAAVTLDSINATELGRFPDADVADSLEHLPGITITRTTGGEGQKVTVRGFGPPYNIVTLNNRILATDDDARDLAFDVLPSELCARACVPILKGWISSPDVRQRRSLGTALPGECIDRSI